MEQLNVNKVAKSYNKGNAEDSGGHQSTFGKSKKCLKLSLEGLLGIHIADKTGGGSSKEKKASLSLAGRLQIM